MNRRTPRFVLHADFDAFSVSVERACNPSLRGRPLVIGGAPGSRGVVIAASPEARSFGVRPAMPVAGALKLCRDLVIVQGNDGLYRRAARAVVDHLRGYSPLYETITFDEAYLDLTGVQRLFGRAVDVGARLQREIAGKFRLESTVGVASNKLVSKVASNLSKPGGFCEVCPGNETEFLAPLSVRQLPGVGPSTESRLWDFNIETIKELAGTDRVLLEKVFGRRGRLLHAHAHGLDDSPVGRTRLPKSIEYEETLDHDSNDRGLLKTVLFGCVEVAASRLRMHGLVIRGVAVHIHYVGGMGSRKMTVLEHPTDIDCEIYAVSEKLMWQCLTRRLTVRLVGVRLFRLSHYSPQLGLFDRGRGYDRNRSLMTAIDCIRQDHGAGAVAWGRAMQVSHRD